jgi:hypothetical protein
MHSRPTILSLLLAAATFLAATSAPAQNLAVPLHWLDGTPPAVPTGVSWGVPWPQGAIQKGQTFSLGSDNGQFLPLQSWTMAYWPDGSIKWTGFATAVPANFTSNLTLAPAPAFLAAKGRTDLATDTPSYIQINTGPLQCVIPKSGPNLVNWIAVGGYPVAENGQLVCILQNGPDGNPEDSPPPREKFVSDIQRVTLEQSGLVRAVVKIEGVHKGIQSGREWLPFTVRLYFYAGQTAVRLVHTIVFDGDQQKDFIRGLGVTFGVPLREQVQNRQVRFSGEDGHLWSEPIQPGGGNANQIAGVRVPDTTPPDPSSPDVLAIWDDFKLVQPNPNGFTLVKRTNPQSTWLYADSGRRASGLAFVGDVTGGLGLSIQDFWQSFPDSLEVQQASSPVAQITGWLWSPDGPAMDMRHYDTRPHGLNASYEDVQPGFSTAYGVARTSELMLYPTASLPSKPDTVALAEAAALPPLLAASPEYIHSTGVFGIWSLPDRSTDFKKGIEDGLDSVLAYYEKQQDERNWYGFWQYGDFMHSYGAARHEWYYDWGGHAWDNTELGAPLWLWYSYLRSGRADVFRLAAAHARNTSETDVYHLGPMAGLGSRHNVIKWGDGSKEVRISQAAHWRPYYYLTTDERMGDIMHQMATADLTLANPKFDPMREAEPQIPGEPQYAARLRLGPDWFALAGDWMTEWERTNDPQWRDRILAGVDSIMAMPYWLHSGQLNGLNPDRPDGSIGPLKGGGSMTVGFDPATGKLTAIRDPVVGHPVPVDYNLATIQGGGEVMFELTPLLNRPDFTNAWLQYCRLGRAPADVLDQDRLTGNEGADARYVQTGQSGPRLAAYAYYKTKDPAYAQRAIQGMLALNGGIENPRPVDAADSLNSVEEVPFGGNTNDASQTGLQTIEILEMVQDQLPTAAPVRTGGRGGRGGRGGASAVPANPGSNLPAPAPASGNTTTPAAN